MKSIFRTAIAGTALAAGSLLAIAGPASAQVYPPKAPPTNPAGPVEISDQKPVKGETIRLIARGLRPGSTVTFTLFSEPVVLGTAVADADGVAEGTFEIPSTVPAGTHTIVASGIDADGNPVEFASTIEVLDDVATTTAGPTGDDLAETGDFTGMLALAGGATLVVGAGMVVVSRRRSA